MLGDDKQRIRASKLCYRSLLVIQEKILTNFDSTLSIALRGLGDYSDPGNTNTNILLNTNTNTNTVNSSSL